MPDVISYQVISDILSLTIFRKEVILMKTKEELNALKEEVETLDKKLSELTEDELEAVVGGGFWEVLQKVGKGITRATEGLLDQ